MAETTAVKQGSAAAPKAATEQTAPQRPSIILRSGKPIIVKVKGKKKKKRKTSRGLKGPQRAMRKTSKAGSRLAAALSSGFRRYRRKANRSSFKRRDGMLRDVFKNSGSGLGLVIRRSSKVPRILSGSIDKRSNRRGIRALRRMMNIFGR